MAGSRVWRPYNLGIPVGAIIAIELDESNARATYLGQELCVAGATLSTYTKPRTTRLRTVTATLDGSLGKIRRKFYVSDITLWATIAGDANAKLQAAVSSDPGDASGGPAGTWSVVFANPETYTRRPHVIDSGLVDGTPNN